MRRLATFAWFTALTFAFVLFLLSMFAAHLEVGIERSIERRSRGLEYSSVNEIPEPVRQDLVALFRRDAYQYALAKAFSLWVPGGLVVLLALTRILLRPPRPRLRTVLILYAALCLASASLAGAYAYATTGAIDQADVTGVVVFLGLLALSCTSLLLIGHWAGDDSPDIRHTPPAAGGAATDTPSGGEGKPPRVRPKVRASPIFVILAPGALLAAAYVAHDWERCRHSIRLPDDLGAERAWHVLRGEFPPSVDAVRGEYVDPQKGRRMFVIRGRLAGRRANDPASARVKATLYGPGQRPLVSREVPPGFLLSDAELAALTPREMDKRFQSGSETAGSAVSSEFVVPFPSPPDGVQEFRVAVIPHESPDPKVVIPQYFRKKMAEDADVLVRVQTGLSAPAPEFAGSRPPAAVPWTEVDVSGVQRRLTALGFYSGPPDGIAGKGTRAALKSFQEASGLAGTGSPDDPTLQRLFRDMPRSPGSRSR